ncbi:MAG: DNA-binding protein [Planctomycetota bacterium]|jgi:superfamily I DNA and/or RNA helicase
MSLDVDAFVRRQLALLALEREAELQAERKALEGTPDSQLEARGVLLRRLTVADLEPGLGGMVAVLRAGAGGPLPSHRFGPGDVVRLRGEGCPPVQAVVARVQRDAVSVALDDEDAELPDVVRLERLAPDVTFRRLQECMQRLRGRLEPAQARLRDVCLLHRDPVFRDPAATTLAPFHDESLDASQREAVVHCMRSEDVALVHGPPGTGKTRTLVEVVRQAVARGERVLATAPSNVAVDNLGERLAAAGLRVVRIGHPARVAPGLRELALAEQVAAADEQRIARDLRRELHELQRKLLKVRSRAERADLRAQLRQLRREQRQLESAIVHGLLSAAQVVLATTTGAADPVLHDRTFDLCVVDEAAQALEAACWVPMLRSRRAVLGGDHCQLPPTVVSEEARRGGLAETLFERLTGGPWGETATRMLTVQYRMHEAIQAWPSQRHYGGRLVAAPVVAGHRLVDLAGVHADGSVELPLLLLDTAGCGFEESAGDEDGSRSNEGEVDCVVRHVQRLVDAGVPAAAVGVLSPYQAQVARLRRALAHLPELEVATVDGFQGREKEALVVSLVRSNDRGEVGFLADQRRLNVALTRARRHLCVVGDSATLAVDEDLEAWLRAVASTGEHRSAFADGPA